jgi:acyl-coenzyme A synthetase/AMP-(fatty) acid ligase
MYGATEIGSPILNRATTYPDNFVEYLEMSDTINNQFKIVDDELYVRGQSVCVNYKDFSHEDDWFKTNDLWEQEGNLIKFIGRSNDIVKINGYQCSLLLIESLIEDKTNLGESLAIPRNLMGSDYIEVAYTNKDANIDKKELSKMLEIYLQDCNIPRKYTYVESLPKTSLGKKIRDVL